MSRGSSRCLVTTDTVASVPSSSAMLMMPTSGWRCATVTPQSSGSSPRRRSTVSSSRRRLASGIAGRATIKDNSSCLILRSVCFTTPDTLGHYVLVDFIEHKKSLSRGRGQSGRRAS